VEILGFKHFVKYMTKEDKARMLAKDIPKLLFLLEERYQVVCIPFK